MRVDECGRTARRRVVAATDPAGILAVLPSDHAVTKPAEFVAAAETAAAAAAAGALVSIGVTPSRPETGYGYLKIGGAYGKEPRARECLAFVEKPDRARAEAYLASGDHLWNAGMFAFRADRLLEEIRVLSASLREGAPYRRGPWPAGEEDTRAPDFVSGIQSLLGNTEPDRAPAGIAGEG